MLYTDIVVLWAKICAFCCLVTCGCSPSLVRTLTVLAGNNFSLTFSLQSARIYCFDAVDVMQQRKHSMYAVDRHLPMKRSSFCVRVLASVPVSSRVWTYLSCKHFWSTPLMSCDLHVVVCTVADWVAQRQMCTSTPCWCDMSTVLTGGSRIRSEVPGCG